MMDSHVRIDMIQDVLYTKNAFRNFKNLPHKFKGIEKPKAFLVIRPFTDDKVTKS
jgi:hypothetical protein